MAAFTFTPIPTTTVHLTLAELELLRAAILTRMTLNARKMSLAPSPSSLAFRVAFLDNTECSRMTTILDAAIAALEV